MKQSRKKKRKPMFLATLCLTALLSGSVKPAFAFDGTGFVYDGYTYNFWGTAVESPAAYQVKDVIDVTDLGGIKLESVEDVVASKDGRLFLVDKTENRINVIKDGEFVVSIKVIRTKEGKIALEEDGNQVVLNSPSGAYYYDAEDELYIADTGSKRVIVLDGTDYTLKRLIGRPENMSGVTEFKPYKVTVDKAGRIYVVVQSSYEGIVELNKDGSFSRYYGVNVPRINLIDYFWKTLASDVQKEKMGKTYAPAFSNITMDSEGFVYAVTYDSSAAHMVFRLNSAGENVLREINWKVMGDISHYSETSKFVDITVSDYGVYAALDATKGAVFLYNYDGELLNVFGSKGNQKGQLKNPTGITFYGENELAISDTELKCVYLLTPTEFGDVALRASEKYYYGKWEEAVALFEEAIRLNANYEVAYVGIGKNYLMKDEYEKAMYYFKLGNAREYYSKAYNGYRNEWVKEHFGVIAVLVVAAIGALVYSEIRYQKKGGKKNK